MDKVFICSLGELINKKYIIKNIDEWKDELIVFGDSKDSIKIFSSICPHFGGEIILHKSKKFLTCKWHAWKFCKETGKCLSFPIKGTLNPYEFKIEPKELGEYAHKIENDLIYAYKK